uniref:Uncharacterized protein n=1 Tax=Aplanochytrium stocchinoi TaxID=215587 RepID=A0A7S3PT72_9STRA|mmetsp:Transcript_4862/g.6154  ORF Transcript_4862/g.6154 Transcript_4862/m.6154 type:complete len:177 (+) Transcript_4862:164-694(+)|eukprot:CAMPEP_0204829802 /NCGR_PEP_ID=MMETSP1346-20131115/8151_1 /ASSEMBLY_ACC=CAM_ASM_000771 /TAXON_ID=215587 /ORGANISM="Aplanochytrium stocchinoi, Strain GSBS06" /LENGTH=176 /DNA_ID=CAMNT_0051959887 /DNA_START=146 /DNA_END=676 /DNA_ORIENTATION=-
MPQENWPCTKYKVDLTGDMGRCKCGWLQADHKAARRKIIKDEFKKKEKANTTEIVDLKAVEKAAEACENFRVDLNNGFQICSCGWDKKAHDEAAIKRAAAATEEKNMVASMRIDERKLAMENGHPCAIFEVDIANNAGGYGVCICGFNRQDHMEFKKVPDEWLKRKEGLTPPKEFT